MSVFDAVTMVSLASGFLGMALRLPQWRVCGFWALANLACFVGEVMSHDAVGACFNGPIGAADAAIWWHGGGGDGTKRRLRALGRAFRGVRRTAPVAGGGS